MEDILTRLKNGEAAEDIAKEFTDALNSAVKAHEEELQIARDRKNKIIDTEHLIMEVVDYLRAWYPAIIPEGKIDITAEELIDAMDETIPKAVELSKAIEDLDKLLNGAAPAKKDAKTEDPITEFFRINGLL